MNALACFAPFPSTARVPIVQQYCRGQDVTENGHSVYVNISRHRTHAFPQCLCLARYPPCKLVRMKHRRLANEQIYELTILSLRQICDALRTTLATFRQHRRGVQIPFVPSNQDYCAYVPVTRLSNHPSPILRRSY